MRLIDADALLERIELGDITGDAIDDIKLAPTVEPEHRKGKWIYDMNLYYRCSECGGLTLIPDNGSRFVDDTESYCFCPQCGADMRGDNNEVN